MGRKLKRGLCGLPALFAKMQGVIAVMDVQELPMKDFLAHLHRHPIPDPACGTGGMLIEAIRYIHDDTP